MKGIAGRLSGYINTFIANQNQMSEFTLRRQGKGSFQHEYLQEVL